jgi:hypothetical protein
MNPVIQKQESKAVSALVLNVHSYDLSNILQLSKT